MFQTYKCLNTPCVSIQIVLWFISVQNTKKTYIHKYILSDWMSFIRIWYCPYYFTINIFLKVSYLLDYGLNIRTSVHHRQIFSCQMKNHLKGRYVIQMQWNQNNQISILDIYMDIKPIISSIHRGNKKKFILKLYTHNLHIDHN